MIINVGLKLAFDIFDVVRVWKTILRQDVHELEEVVLDFVRVVVRVVRLIKSNGAFTALLARNQAQTTLEDVLEDDLANTRLLLHVFLHKLNQELVNELFHMRWSVSQVLWLYEPDDALKRGGVPDDFFLSLRIVPNELSQNFDHIVVDRDCEIHVSNARAVKNFQQRLHGLLVLCLGDFLGELLLVGWTGNEDLNESQHVE